jgi:hypothetical protein
MAPAFIAPDNETEGEVRSKIGKNVAKNKCHQLLNISFNKIQFLSVERQWNRCLQFTKASGNSFLVQKYFLIIGTLNPRIWPTFLKMYVKFCGLLRNLVV